MIKVPQEAQYFLKEDGQIDEKRIGFNNQDLEITKAVLQSLTTKRFLQNLPQFKEIFDLIRSFSQLHSKNIKKIIRKRLLEECQLKKEKLREKTIIIDQIQNLQEEVKLKIQGAQELPQKDSKKINNQILIEELEIFEQLPYDIKLGKCYCCGEVFKNVHFFYDQLCVQCGDFNFLKRNLKCDLTGRIALVTGGRIKIGYQIVLQLLRNNCYTIVTTRFPKEAAFRYSKEEDFQKWKHLLKIYGVDFKSIPLVYRFCDFLKLKCPKLDIIINNAAQTIRRAPIYNSNFEEFEKFNKYFDLETDIQNLLDPEFQFQTFELQIPKQIGSITNNNIKSLLEFNQLQQSEKTQSTLYFIDQQEIQYVPEIFDANNQIIDLGNKNTWRLKQEEVSLQELLEVQIINSIAPFIICAQLKQILEKSQFQERFIINVSAVEGQFNRFYKSPNHPHTNMAKASLNMMTRTSGQHYALSGIYMNAVDTGWVTDENPKNFNNHFTAPLDEIDGAMRVLDPIFLCINERKFIHSKFFKNYKEANW